MIPSHFPAMLPDLPAALLPFIGDVPISGTKQQPLLMFFGEILPGSFQIDVERFGDALVNVFARATHGAEFTDDRETAIRERLRRIGMSKLGIESIARAQTVAVQTHSLRAIETEELRGRRVVTLVAKSAGVVGGE